MKVLLDGQPELEPEPGLGHHVGADGTLASVQGHLLVLQLLELHPGSLATSTGLQPGKDAADLVLTLLLHPAANAGPEKVCLKDFCPDGLPEEDEGVAQPELLLIQLDDVHHSLSGGLVVLGLGNGCCSDDVVPRLELRVGKLVGEASCREKGNMSHIIFSGVCWELLTAADGNSSEHTVALVLVHHQARLNTTGLLVSVGHNTTDEVGLSLVKGGHQVVKLTLEVGGHSLAALALLPVLILGSLQGLVKERWLSAR